MAESVFKKEILVCGHAAAARINSGMLQRLNGGLVVTGAHTKDKLIEELTRGQQPICIMEHDVPLVDKLKDLAKLYGSEEAAFQFLSRYNMVLSKVIPAYELLPELVNRSPETSFVIVCHCKGGGISPEQRKLYKTRTEVVKVMGFINSKANYNYLTKLLSRVYLGKTWKPEADS